MLKYILKIINNNKIKSKFKNLFFDEIDKVKIKLDFNPNGKNFHRKILYNKNNEIVGYYDHVKKQFWLSNEIIITEFNENYYQLVKVIKSYIEKRYELKNIEIMIINDMDIFIANDYYKLFGI